jgi:hypothetical protein
MSSRKDRSKAVAEERWTVKQLARELALILSASACIITLLMLLKGLQRLI